MNHFITLKTEKTAPRSGPTVQYFMKHRAQQSYRVCPSLLLLHHFTSEMLRAMFRPTILWLIHDETLKLRAMAYAMLHRVSRPLALAMVFIRVLLNHEFS